MDISKLYGDENDRYPITKPPQIVYGGNGSVIGYYIEDSLGNKNYVEVKDKKKIDVVKDIKTDVKDVDGLVLYLFKDHTISQLNNMLKSNKFVDIREQVKMAIIMYNTYNIYFKNRI